MTRINHDYLEDMVHSLVSIQKFVKNLTWSQFEEDEKTIYAVIRGFEILGEAASKVTDEYKLAHPELPWREMITMRNKLIHDYFGVNLAVVWETLQKDVPALLSLLKDIRE